MHRFPSAEYIDGLTHAARALLMMAHGCIVQTRSVARGRLSGLDTSATQIKSTRASRFRTWPSPSRPLPALSGNLVRTRRRDGLILPTPRKHPRVCRAVVARGGCRGDDDAVGHGQLGQRVLAMGFIVAHVQGG